MGYCIARDPPRKAVKEKVCQIVWTRRRKKMAGKPGVKWMWGEAKDHFIFILFIFIFIFKKQWFLISDLFYTPEF